MIPNHRTTAYFYLFITSILWGFAGPVIKFTLDYFPPSVFLTYRFAISTVVALISFLLFSKNLPKKTKDLPVILFYGFLTSTAALGLLFLGFDKTTALTGSVFSALSPVFVTAAGAFFLHEHVTRREKWGISIALGGTIFIILDPFFTTATGVPVSFEGNMYHIAALIVTMATAILAKVILRDSLDALTLTHIAFTVGFATMLPITFAHYAPEEVIRLIAQAPLAGHLGVLYMAIFSGTIAYTLWHFAEKSIEIGESSLFTYLMPVFAAPLSIIWLNEKITPVFIIGAILIASGVILAEYRRSVSKSKYHAVTRRRKR